MSTRLESYHYFIFLAETYTKLDTISCFLFPDFQTSCIDLARLVIPTRSSPVSWRDTETQGSKQHHGDAKFQPPFACEKSVGYVALSISKPSASPAVRHDALKTPLHTLLPLILQMILAQIVPSTDFSHSSFRYCSRYLSILFSVQSSIPGSILISSTLSFSLSFSPSFSPCV